jgi:hypothetical protein
LTGFWHIHDRFQFLNLATLVNILHPRSVDVLLDPGRHIGTVDPLRREQQIGVGCALENLLLAAPAMGWTTRPALFPDADEPTLVARVGLSPGAMPPSPLVGAIPHRHTNRGAYDPRPLDASTFAGLEALGRDLPLVSLRWFTTGAQRRAIGEAIVQATEAVVADREQARDSAAWFRHSWQEVQRKRDGLTIDTQALPLWMRAAAKMLPPPGDERVDRLWIESTRDVQVATAPAFGLLLARDAENPLQRVQGGRLWQRMHLWSHREGLAMQPLNQMAERADRERDLGLRPRFRRVLLDLAGRDGWYVLMPFRLGRPTGPALRSPRRGLEEVIVA